MAEPQQTIWKTQADRAFALIRGDILACRVRPGAKLKINELCAQYGLSLGSVREALSRLGAEGLVTVEPQKGCSVPLVSKEDLTDLTRARIEIEGVCLVDAITHGDLRWESEVLAAFHRLSHLPERSGGSRPALDEDWSIAHLEFHAALVSACGSKWLLRTRTMLFQQAERYRRLSAALRDEVRDVDAEHQELLKAVIARDPVRGRALMSAHLETTTRIILERLDRLGLDAVPGEQPAAGKPQLRTGS